MFSNRRSDPTVRTQCPTRCLPVFTHDSTASSQTRGALFTFRRAVSFAGCLDRVYVPGDKVSLFYINGIKMHALINIIYNRYLILLLPYVGKGVNNPRESRRTYPKIDDN